jgi:hypothetical protein
MYKSKFVKFAIALLISLSTTAFALEVDENELKSTGTIDTVVFVNYTGPHAKIDSLNSIKKIGSDLGTVIAADPEKMTNTGAANKYSVIHAIDPSESGKLDADILLIGPNATVDHIKNLRYIIASYLSSSYGYSEQDAETVAVFVTVYNAVYRGNTEYFAKKYKNIVNSNLTADKCGLALNYKDWPGKSQIVIPLYDVKGGLSSVDTSVISDKEVVKHMQEDDDKNVESRKQMVDIKEREAEEATEKAQEAQKKAVEEQKKLQEEKQKTQEVKKEAETAKKEAEQAKKVAEKNPNDKKAQEEAAKKQEVAEEKQEELKAQEEKQAEQEEKTEEAKETAAEKQAVADKKTNEAQEERKEIAKDQQEVIEKAIKDAATPAVYGMELTDEDQLLSTLIKVNSQNGQIIKTSPVTYIRNRTMFQAGENFIAIAGENKGNGAVKLVLLSPDTMEISAESNEIVHENSVLIQDGTDYYCVIQDGKNWVLAKYDQELTLNLKSPVPLMSSTPVSITEAGILVTGAKGYVKLLDKSDLTEISEPVDISNAK